MYDLAVAYRIYPKVSRPSMGLPFDDSKLKQAELCVRSFRRVVSSLRVKVWAVLDGCPPEYADMFQRYFAPEDLVLVHLQGEGNGATFGKQMDILLNQTDAEAVYFAEDDYLYLPGDFSVMLQMLREPGVHFLSPFDHPDDYFMDLQQFPRKLKAFGGLHWHNAASTCLTFLTTRRKLQQYESTFRTYQRGNYDASLWFSITKYRLFNVLNPMFYNPTEHFLNLKVLVKTWRYGLLQNLFGRRASLWTPMPTLALHLNRHRPAPGYDLALHLMEENNAGDGKRSHQQAREARFAAGCLSETV